MTRKEVVSRLEVLKEIIDMAIRSLKAWDNLEKEMEEEIYSYDAFPDIWYGISEAYDIIKKYLKEVEDEHKDLC